MQLINPEKIEEYSSLNEKQKEFIKNAISNKNIFLTGEAGTGKSFAVKTLIKLFEAFDINYALTASTGVAALNIGGQTLHSWMGIGLAEETADYLADKIKKRKDIAYRIKNTSFLIIDEISMIKGDLFDKIDFILKKIRRKKEPFGGLNLILCGDPFQLPPVFKYDEKESFFFESEAYKNGSFLPQILTEQHRQESGSELLSILSDLRLGNTSKIDKLNGRLIPPPQDIPITKLYCLNKDVEKFNQEKLSELQTPEKIYEANDTGSEIFIKALDKNCIVPRTLKLKVGAQVMLCVNVSVENGLVNGSIGRVEAFTDSGVLVDFGHDSFTIPRHTWEMKEQVFDGAKSSFKTKAKRTQIPLKLAWATSVHKAQGLTLDKVSVNLQEAFAAGQVYVALSRVKDINGLWLETPVNKNKVFTNKKCLDFYQQIVKSYEK